MTKLLIQGVIVILIWVGAWGILEMAVTSVSGDNTRIRLATYAIFLFLGIFMLWLAEVALD